MSVARRCDRRPGGHLGARMPAWRASPVRNSPVKTLYPIAALLASVFLLVSGNALVSVVAPIRGSLDGFGDLTIGLLGSAYFVGMLRGHVLHAADGAEVGHIRAFAAFVAIGAVSVDMMAINQTPLAWLGARASVGFTLAGIYAVIESWINGAASNANRGSLYAVYQIVNFAASAVGQLLLRGLDPHAFAPFAVSSALFALAVVPLAMTSADAPELPRFGTSCVSRSIASIAPISLAAALGGRRGQRRLDFPGAGLCIADRRQALRRDRVHRLDRHRLGAWRLSRRAPVGPDRAAPDHGHRR